MIKKSLRPYIAHPFNSRKFVRQWQLDMQTKYPTLRFLNPFYSKLSKEQWKTGDVSNDNYYKKLKYKEIIQNDLNIISRSDMVVAVVDGSLSYGTIQEMVYAYIFHKPLIIICTNGQSEHPWFKYHATKIFKTFEGCESYISKLLRGQHETV